MDVAFSTCRAMLKEAKELVKSVKQVKRLGEELEKEVWMGENEGANELGVADPEATLTGGGTGARRVGSRAVRMLDTWATLDGITAPPAPLCTLAELELLRS